MDNRFANSSQLDEKIGAAYSQLNFPLSEKVKVQAGLRYEFTQTQVNSLIDNSVFVDREYGNFFPSVFLSYKINDFNNLNLSSSRRINRPSFTDMAPFVFFVDLEQAFEGNVSLKPSYTNNFQLDYRYKSVNLTVQYTDEKDVISRFQPSIDSSSGFVTIRPANVDEQQTLSTIISYSFYPVSFWNLRLFSTFAYTALKNNVAESSIDITNSSLRFNMNNNFNLGNDFSFQVWGYYNSRAVSGINIVLPAGALNLALQKKYKNFTYTLNATNILDTQRWRFESINTAQNFYQDFDVNFSPPQIRFAVSTSFGNQKIKQKQLRKSEEASRVNL
jgi:outer membrane receptor protein involved in Fe transport